MPERESPVRPREAGKGRSRDGPLTEPHVDRVIARLAVRRRGVVTRVELLAADVSRYAIDRRLRSGALHRLHRGIYAVGHLALHPQARLVAALLAGGKGSVLADRTAVEHWQMLPPVDGPIHILRPDSRPTRRSGLVLHCAVLEPVDLRVHEGLPITSPVRTLQDIAATAPLELERAVNEAQARRLIRPGELGVVAARRGAKALRAVLEDRDGFTRSEAERLLLGLIRRAGLPRPATNSRIGPWEVDFLWSGERLVVETDGYAAHSGRRAFERDRRKDADLLANGYRVVRLSYRRLADHPERTVAQLSTLLAQVTTRPAQPTR